MCAYLETKGRNPATGAYERVKDSFNSEADTLYSLAEFQQPASSIALMHQVCGVLRRELGRTEHVHIIEAGCGNGYWLTQIASWPEWSDVELRLEGFDLSDRLIDLARQWPCPPRRRFAFATGNLLDYRPEQPADIVFCYDVIQHVPRADRLAALRQLLSMTRPGGLIAVVDNHYWTSSAMPNNLRKWLTRHTPIQLISQRYLLATYPCFGWLEGQFQKLGAPRISERLRWQEGRAPKRAAIFRRP